MNATCGSGAGSSADVGHYNSTLGDCLAREDLIERPVERIAANDLYAKPFAGIRERVPGPPDVCQEVREKSGLGDVATT
jgi:hypothetical protein